MVNSFILNYELGLIFIGLPGFLKQLCVPEDEGSCTRQKGHWDLSIAAVLSCFL